MSKVKKILFVCTGNTCRSPMAKGLADKLITEMGLKITTDSAGLTAFEGDFPTNNAVEALKAFGVDISEHRAKPFTAALGKEADRIFVMTKRHLDGLLTVWPQFSGKTLTLCDDDIPDPYGCGTEIYENTAKAIEAGIEKRLYEIAATEDE